MLISKTTCEVLPAFCADQDDEKAHPTTKCVRLDRDRAMATDGVMLAVLDHTDQSKDVLFTSNETLAVPEKLHIAADRLAWVGRQLPKPEQATYPQHCAFVDVDTSNAGGPVIVKVDPSATVELPNLSLDAINENRVLASHEPERVVRLKPDQVIKVMQAFKKTGCRYVDLSLPKEDAAPMRFDDADNSRSPIHQRLAVLVMPCKRDDDEDAA